MADAPPLFSIPGAATPEGGAAEWVLGEGGVRLRAALFPAVGTPRGSVVLSPGRTESIEKYYEVVDELRRRGFVVLVHDWRGQGLSQRLAADPHRGHARGWRHFVGDFIRILNAFEMRLPKPWIALGHSMGGCLTALALTEGESRFSGAVLSAPMLGLQLGKSSPAVIGLVAGVMTRLGQSQAYVRRPSESKAAFEGNILSHDQDRWGRTPALLAAYPDLVLGDVTWGWLDFALSAGRRLADSPAVARLQLPVTIVEAGEERLVDNAATRAFAARLPHGRYVAIEGASHEILMETDEIRAKFWEEFDRLTAEVVA